MTAPVESRIEIDGSAIEVADLPGDAGAPLVLLHEGLGSVGLWREFPSRLAAATGRRVIAFSRFGHGRSGPPPRPRTPAFFHEEALEVLPAVLELMDAGEPVLVGHSDGASIALIHAAHRPVSALVLIAPHVFVEPVTVAAIRETRVVYREGALRDRMARHHDDPDAAFWGWCDVWLDPAFARWSLEPEALQVAAPALLIQGAGDPYGTLEQLTRIEARTRGPAARLVLPGGHSPHLEHGERVAQAVREFLAGLPLGGPTRARPGVVEQVAIAAEHEELPATVKRARVIAGHGPVGDRNFAADGAGRGEALTLIAAEALEDLRLQTGIELSHQASRRNVLTRGIDLNALVGRRFTVGDVLCEGVELCEPCKHLQALTQKGILRGLVHRGGLRADVLEGGTISPGDAVRPV